MWRTITSESLVRRSSGHPAPAANIHATLPPATSNESVALSYAWTSPMSWSIAATYRSSSSNAIPMSVPRAAAHR